MSVAKFAFVTNCYMQAKLRTMLYMHNISQLPLQPTVYGITAPLIRSRLWCFTNLLTYLLTYGPRPQNDLSCVEWDAKLYSLTHGTNHVL